MLDGRVITRGRADSFTGRSLRTYPSHVLQQIIQKISDISLL